jgi:uncharacterized protein YutE (UPF0331/DUF86 family)
VTLDADVVRGRCQEIEHALDRLDRIRAAGRDDFLVNPDSQDIACYRLLVGIEAALALCYHVSARRLRAAPEDYADCFAGLEKAGIIPPALSNRLQQMARFRNLLVHMYWRIDYGRVFGVMELDVEDLRQFSRIVAGLL